MLGVPTRQLIVRKHQSDGSHRFGDDSWSAWVDDIVHDDNIGPIDTASGTVDLLNREYGYGLPYILTRVVGDVVIWCANPLLGEIPPFDDIPMIAFDAETYLSSFPDTTTGLPPLASNAEITRYADKVLSRIPPYSAAEYCVPAYDCDDSGRLILKCFEELLRSGHFVVPQLVQGRELTSLRAQFEVGIVDRTTIIIDVSRIADIEWFRLIEPGVFPIWISSGMTSRFLK